MVLAAARSSTTSTPDARTLETGGLRASGSNSSIRFLRLALKEILASYPNAKQVFWTQEEPRNLGGGRSSISGLGLLPEGASLRYVGRAASASPATVVCYTRARAKADSPESLIGDSKKFPRRASLRFRNGSLPRAPEIPATAESNRKRHSLRWSRVTKFSHL